MYVTQLMCRGWLDWQRAFGGWWTQVQALAVVSGALMAAGTLVTCAWVREPEIIQDHDSVNDDEDDGEHQSPASTAPVGMLRDMARVWLALPGSVHRLFWAQFFAWFGWFPFLFFRYIPIIDL